ncbi:MAG: RNA polymerase-associated protein RapA [Aestuariibacter sp.]
MSELRIPAPGQRWLSNTEVELGLGTVLELDERTITVMFPASGETRRYARKEAPLTRVAFKVGDEASHHEGWTFTIRDVQKEHQIYHYHGVRNDDQSDVIVKETFLAHNFVLSEPLERLLSGHYEEHKWFAMRKESTELRQQHLSSPLLGYLGGRMQLIPHQLHIAKEVGKRVAPRVLLADEVGLGKTIEAALIIHQQLLTERAQRVLIVVPDSLVNQWLVEMLRKFNLSFAIFDAERCESLADEPVNPFETEQLVLCSLNFLTHNSRYFEQALSASWDLLVVDEAHHLRWSSGNPSQEYEVIEHLSAKTPGVLLLTATPDQLGHESHFARLRLLDADRFHDYPRFLAEEQTYQNLADAIEPLVSGASLDEDQWHKLQQLLPDVAERFADINEQQDNRDALISELLDRHGTGRILFRNARSSISGFPKRRLNKATLQLPEQYQQATAEASVKAALTPEISYAGSEFWSDFDPRIDWLIELLQQYKQEKILVICANAVTAMDIADAIRVKAGTRATVFHEEMSILERDKAANYFAQIEEGAQVLLASEIGSEGRNFQFSHHLVLFDLPLNPDLLEQRIGRLDRIGQRFDIDLHVPVFSGTAQEVLVDWYDQGLSAFAKTCPIGAMVFEEVEELLLQCLEQPEDTQQKEQLLAQTAELYRMLMQKMEQGRDKLLEINSSGKRSIGPFIEQLQDQDDSPRLEKFMGRLLDTLGVVQEDKDESCYLLKPTESMVSQIPGLHDEGMTVTYERETATQLEHIQYLTWDHPLVHNAIDMLLSDVQGKSSLAFVAQKEKPAGFFWLECFFVLAPSGSKALQLNQYFPPQPVSLCIDGNGKMDYPESKHYASVPKKIGSQLLKALTTHIEKAAALARKHAEHLGQKVKEERLHHIDTVLSDEILRLRQLREVNPAVRQEEIEALEEQKTMLLAAAQSASLQLEAIQLVVNNP